MITSPIARFAKPLRFFSFATLALSFSLTSALPAAAAGSASQQLQTLDNTTYSGRIDAHVTLYGAPDKKGNLPEPERYPAQLLFERPDRFKIVLRPGKKNEFRAVGEAGIVRWRDLGTGFTGKDDAAKITDPLALGLLGTAGELLRFGRTKDLPNSKYSPVYGARLSVNTYASNVESAIAWFAGAALTGMEFTMIDGSRVFVSVLSLEQNVETAPGDFQL